MQPPISDRSFTSPLHDERIAAWLGLALGICFTTCFVTGFISHEVQRGPQWFQDWWPSRPVSFYRVSQGTHVLTGLVSIPLLLAKLWVVYPRFWQWPPLRDLGHAFERASLAALVGGAIFQLSTGLLNIFYWYAFPFPFPRAHYASAWITIGGLTIHVAAKWRTILAALTARIPRGREANAGLTRRGFLLSSAAASSVVFLTTAGAAIPALSRLALLSARQAGVGPQGVPVNHGASEELKQLASDPTYRLTVGGRVARPLSLSLAELRALATSEADLPIACVEGWSTSAHWRGVRVRDLLRMAEAASGSSVMVSSLEAKGAYRRSLLNADHAGDPLTLIALELNGEPLHIDHGYPARLIAPNRPGVEQTKWVSSLTVI